MKFPLIYTLTDETFSISSTMDAPEGVNSTYFYAAISFFNYSYWIAGTAIGALFGNMISFDSTGIDFALTALFIVLFVEQLKTREGRISGIMGLLVVYCFKDTDFMSLSSVAPLLLSSALVVTLHLWKRNTILSIATGTAVYMILIRVM